jgi:hypothetical protein
VDGPNDLIAAFWDDLDPSQGGGVFWQVDGAPGARRFIAEWHQVPVFRDPAFIASIPAGSHTFEVILHETTNLIELRYGTLAGAPESDGYTATAGIESANGMEGVGASCNSPGILVDGVRFRFTGPQLFAPAFAWSDPDSDLLLSTAPAYFLPAAGRCDVRLRTDANDPLGLCPLTDSRLITVPDIAPPVVMPGQEDLHCVWPPNHRYRCFSQADFTPGITDNCGAVTWKFVDCASDQADTSSDPDDLPNDCVVGPDGLSFKVRAERLGDVRAGRRYAVTVVGRDESANVSGSVVIGYIHVPHNRDRSRNCLEGNCGH